MWEWESPSLRSTADFLPVRGPLVLRDDLRLVRRGERTPGRPGRRIDPTDSGTDWAEDSDSDSLVASSGGLLLITDRLHSCPPSQPPKPRTSDLKTDREG